MTIILLILGAALGLGALLAAPAIAWPFNEGLLGAALLIAAALAARLHWERRAHARGDDPGAPEREVWAAMVGTAMICGFLIVVLLTPGSEVHTRVGGTGGWQTWTMFIGAVVAWALVRKPEVPRDERDRAIRALGDKVGYFSVCLLLVLLALFLGFAPPDQRVRLTHWLLGNTLIAVIMLATLTQQVAQLFAYHRDARAAATDSLR